MRTRVTALAAVVAFALAVATVAVLAGRGDDQDLVKLPIGSSGGAGAEDAAASTASRSSLAYPAFGPVEYRVEGRLPDLPTTAPAYRLGSSTTPAEVGRLAAALGLDGPVREDGGGWVVTVGDRELRVESFAGLPWYLGPACPEVAVSSGDAGVAVSCAASSGVSAGGGSATAVDPICKDGAAECIQPAGPAPDVDAPGPAPATTTVCRGGPVECAPLQPAPRPAAVPAPPVPTQSPTTVACSTDAGCIAPASCPPGAVCAFPEPYPSPTPPDKPPRPADLPSRDEAGRLAREAFTRLGVDLDGFTVEDGWLTWEARVEPRVDGLPVFGLGSSLSIGAKGEIVRANGFLARPDRIGDYPLVGLEKGLERLRGDVAIGPRPLVADDLRSFPPGAEPAGAPGVAEGEAEGVVEDPGAATTVPGAAPAIGDCSKPTVICDPPPGGTPAITVAPAPSEPPPDAPVPSEPAPEPEPVVRTITGAHLALMQVDAVLVPVYVFELDGGDESFPVPAVTDEWLQQETSAKRD